MSPPSFCDVSGLGRDETRDAALLLAATTMNLVNLDYHSSLPHISSIQCRDGDTATIYNRCVVNNPNTRYSDFTSNIARNSRRTAKNAPNLDGATCKGRTT